MPRAVDAGWVAPFALRFDDGQDVTLHAVLTDGRAYLVSGEVTRTLCKPPAWQARAFRCAGPCLYILRAFAPFATVAPRFPALRQLQQRRRCSQLSPALPRRARAELRAPRLPQVNNYTWKHGVLERDDLLKARGQLRADLITKGALPRNAPSSLLVPISAVLEAYSDVLDQTTLASLEDAESAWADSTEAHTFTPSLPTPAPPTLPRRDWSDSPLADILHGGQYTLPPALRAAPALARQMAVLKEACTAAVHLGRGRRRADAAATWLTREREIYGFLGFCWRWRSAAPRLQLFLNGGLVVDFLDFLSGRAWSLEGLVGGIIRVVEWWAASARGAVRRGIDAYLQQLEALRLQVGARAATCRPARRRRSLAHTSVAAVDVFHAARRT